MLMTDIKEVTNAIGDEMKISFPEFQSLRVYGTLEYPLFLIKDIQSILKISNQNYERDYDEHDDYIKIKIHHGGQMREMVALTEGGLYNLIFRSKTDLGKKFRKFITIILKQLRLKGSITLSEANQKLQEYENKIQNLETQVDEKHKEVEIQTGLTDKYFNRNFSLLCKLEHYNLRAIENEWNRGSPEYKLQQFKEKYFKPVYFYTTAIPKKLVDVVEHYDTDEEATETDERIWMFGFKPSGSGASELVIYVPPKTTKETIVGKLKIHLIEDSKNKFLASPRDLQEILDELD